MMGGTGVHSMNVRRLEQGWAGDHPSGCGSIRTGLV